MTVELEAVMAVFSTMADKNLFLKSIHRKKFIEISEIAAQLSIEIL